MSMTDDGTVRSSNVSYQCERRQASTSARFNVGNTGKDSDTGAGILMVYVVMINQLAKVVQ